VISLPATHRVKVHVICHQQHHHELCMTVKREVHPDLRCALEQSAGFSYGGGGCTLPTNLQELVERELVSNYQEARRRGYVLLAA
jgi:hypothetical protein